MILPVLESMELKENKWLTGNKIFNAHYLKIINFTFQKNFRISNISSQVHNNSLAKKFCDRPEDWGAEIFGSGDWETLLLYYY